MCSGLLPDSAFGTAAAVAGSRQPHSYSAREGSTGSNGGDSNSSNSGSSDDDAYLNSMDDSISLSAAVASNK